MNPKDKLAGDVNDPVLTEALRHFKASVEAWSEAEYHRPRTIAAAAHRTWRLAASWALGCVLVAGSAAGIVVERRHQQSLARTAAMQKAAQQKSAAQQPATAPANVEDEDLLATVDRDVSQQVPTALEPLTQLMDNNGTE